MHHANRTPKHPSTDPVTDVWSHAKIDPTAGHSDSHDDPMLPKRKRGYSLKVACGSSAAAALPPVLLEAAAIVTATTAVIIFVAVILAALAI